MSLVLPPGPDGAAVRLVVNYCNNVDKYSTVDGAEIALTSASGEVVKGLSAVIKAIASSGPSSTGLLGKTPEEEALVDEWIGKAADGKDGVKEMEAWLLPRTFLAGSGLTLADLVQYARWHSACAALAAGTDAGAGSPCLLRWFEHVQHVAGAARVLPAVEVAKPGFQPPPVEEKPPAALRDKKTGASGKEGSGESSSKAEAAAGAEAGGGKKRDKAGDGGKKEKKEKAGGADAGDKKPEEARIDALDIRVGTIVQVEKHPQADSLYLEQIDLGDEKPRQVISGLLKFVPLEEMQNRRVVVVTNLKPAKLAGLPSHGMVLCASDAGKTRVDPIIPPDSVPNGEKITFDGFDQPAKEQVNNSRTKLLEKLFPDLKTDAAGVATYKGVPFMTSKGPVTSTLPGGSVA